MSPKKRKRIVRSRGQSLRHFGGRILVGAAGGYVHGEGIPEWTVYCIRCGGIVRVEINPSPARKAILAEVGQKLCRVCYKKNPKWGQKR